MRFPVVLAVTLTAALASCGENEEKQKPLDPRAARVFEQVAVPSEVAARANDSKFSEFRALCTKQRESADAIARFRKSIDGHVRTPEQAEELGRLMAAMMPIDEQITEWFERADFDALDKEAMRFIHGGAK